MNNKELRRKLKKTPEVKIKRLIEYIGLVGLEKEIAYRRCLEHKQINEICEDLNISEATYHRYFDNILYKIDDILYKGLDIEKRDRFF